MRFASAYLICNKEAGTVARVLIHEHFSVFALPNQIHSDNGAEFVNKLWTELFSELKILHTRIPLITPHLTLWNDAQNNSEYFEDYGQGDAK